MVTDALLLLWLDDDARRERTSTRLSRASSTASRYSIHDVTS